MNSEETIKKNYEQLADERLARRQKRERDMEDKRAKTQQLIQSSREKRDEEWWKEWELS